MLCALGIEWLRVRDPGPTGPSCHRTQRTQDIARLLRLLHSMRSERAMCDLSLKGVFVRACQYSAGPQTLTPIHTGDSVVPKLPLQACARTYQ